MTACSTCCEANPDHARFCLACGSQLAPRKADVRKMVTVVFTDIVGSTDLGKRLDPEALKGVLTEYFGRMPRRPATRRDDRLPRRSWAALAVLAELLAMQARRGEAADALAGAITMYERKGNPTSAAEAKAMLTQLESEDTAPHVILPVSRRVLTEAGR